MEGAVGYLRIKLNRFVSDRFAKNFEHFIVQSAAMLPRALQQLRHYVIVEIINHDFSHHFSVGGGGISQRILSTFPLTIG